MAIAFEENWVLSEAKSQRLESTWRLLKVKSTTILWEYIEIPSNNVSIYDDRVTSSLSICSSLLLLLQLEASMINKSNIVSNGNNLKMLFLLLEDSNRNFAPERWKIEFVDIIKKSIPWWLIDGVVLMFGICFDYNYFPLFPTRQQNEGQLHDSAKSQMFCRRSRPRSLTFSQLLLF